MGVTDEVYFPTKEEGGLLEGGSNIPPYNSIGHHIIRNNTISRCGQTGIYGCYGAVASLIEGNTIFGTNYRNEWFGSNQAGIKILFPIDVIIRNNRIIGKPGLKNGAKGIWLDWGSQNTRVTGNIISDFNFPGTDGLKLEVNFGPVIVDNNIIIRSHVMEEGNGSVFVHNLFCDNSYHFRKSPDRVVPYYKSHSTTRAGKAGTSLNYVRLFNNIFIGNNVKDVFKKAIAGTEIIEQNNVFMNNNLSERTNKGKSNSIYSFQDDHNKFCLSINIRKFSFHKEYHLISSDFIGEIPFANMKMENPDGSPLNISHDIRKRKIKAGNVVPGPFQNLVNGKNNFTLKVKQE